MLTSDASVMGQHLAEEILVAAIEATVGDVVVALVRTVALMALFLIVLERLVTGQYIQMDESMIMIAADLQVAPSWKAAALDAMWRLLIHLAICKGQKEE